MRVASMRLMKTLQVRNVPDATHRELRTRAAASGLSLSEFVLEELERVASKPTIADVMRRAASRAGGPSTETIVAAVRAGRDA